MLPETLEKWPVGLVQHLLPRHLQIIYDINLFFLQRVERTFPHDRDMLTRVSIIEESQPKMVRMAHLAIVGSHKVNGVAELHSDLIKTTIFKDFVEIYGPDKFTNVTNGITPRRWLHQANPRLSELIASKCGGDGFLKDLTQLNRLEAHANDAGFRREWAEIKYANKVRLAKHIKSVTDVTVNPAALFDVQVKRIHEYKRQQLNIFGVIHRYLTLKGMSAEERKKQLPRLHLWRQGGPGLLDGQADHPPHQRRGVRGELGLRHRRPAQGHLPRGLQRQQGRDDMPGIGPERAHLDGRDRVRQPGRAGAAELADGATQGLGNEQHEVCPQRRPHHRHVRRRQRKWAGGHGRRDGPLTQGGCQIEITREIGESNIFLFGNLAEDVEDLRHAHTYGSHSIDGDLERVFGEIESGRFGAPHDFGAMVAAVRHHGDYYLVSDDFHSYMETHRLVDEAYRNQDEWVAKCITAVARMGFFSSDRCINEYADGIWNVEPLVVQE